MKSVKLFFIIAILTTVAGGVKAQSARYLQTMKTLKAELVAAEEKEAFIDLRNKFNRVATVESQEWLPCYYEAFCTLAWAFEEKDPAVKARLAAEVAAQLESLQNYRQYAAENEVLKGRWLQLRSGLPGENFMKVGLELYDVIPAITEKYPDNPRGWLLLGELIVNAPKGFMGYSQQDAVEAFQKAKNLLQNVNELADIKPTWGLSMAEAYLQRYNPNSTGQAPAKAAPANNYELLDRYYNPQSGLSNDEAIALFEAKSKEQPNDYAWSYHHAFCLVQAALKCKDLAAVDPYCDRAAAIIEQLPANTPKDEVLCLNALIQVTRIRVNFQKRGLRNYMASEALLDEAYQLNPNNPRIQYLKGQNQANLPVAMGGGTLSAAPFFEKCEELSAAHPGNPYIRWGTQGKVNF